MNEELKKLAKAWRSGNPLASGPDRQFTERLAAEAVINHLGWQLKFLDSPPQRRLSPDVLATLKCGRRIGPEVTELCDSNYIEFKQAAKRDKRQAPFPRLWDQASLQTALCASLMNKVQKRENLLLSPDGTWCDPLDEYLIVVHTDEPLITREPQTADSALRDLAGCGKRVQQPALHYNI